MTAKRTIIKLVSIIIALLVVNIFIFIERPQNSNVLAVHFLDIGQGDAILIETPSGVQILLDGGPNTAITRQLSEVLTFFDRTIDILIASHSDLDHVGGFPEVLKRYQVKKYYDNGFEDNDELNKQINLMLQNEKDLERNFFRTGDVLVLDQEKNINLKIIWSHPEIKFSDNNDKSVVAKLEYGKVSFLFTGDAGVEVEQELISANKNHSTNNILDSTVLKVGHHGSKTSTSPDFLKEVSPALAIISAGKDNKFGHPDQIVLTNLKESGAEIKNTAESGRITVYSDGETFWIKEESLFNDSSFLQSLVSTILINGS